MKYHRVLVLILVGWYLVLALGHYFNQRPLWNDEQCVLNSIVQLSPHSLFSQPLLNDQAFPRFYLWIIQQFSRTFHHSLLSLRFFSLMAMMVAFFVWITIARRHLNHAWDLGLFIGSWAASMPLVYYAAELKPYSMDVLVSGLIVLFLTEQNEIKKNADVYRMTLLFLPILALFSYAAIFLLLLPLYNLIRDCFVQRRGGSELSFYLSSSILILGLLYIFDFRVSLPHLVEVYWHDYFISLHSLKDFLNTFGKGMNNLISRTFAESPRWVKAPSRIFIGLGIAYMVIVSWSQFKKDRFMLRSITVISLAILLIQLGLAILRVYPLGVPRLSLFFSPLLLLVTILGIRSIEAHQKALGNLLRVIFAGYLIFISLGIACDVFLKGDLGAESRLYTPR